MKNSIYIYGVIKTSDGQEFGEIGIGENAASKVFTREFKDLAAVISYSQSKIYDSLGKEEVVRDLATHEFTIEKVMERFTVIPMKFGTLVETEDEVSQFLEKGYLLLSNELDKMEGKIELEVVAWWELPRILEILARRNSQIREMQQQLALKDGDMSIEEQVTLGQRVGQALNAEKAQYQQEILQTLKQEAEDFCLHDLAKEEMIIDAGFLLEKPKKEIFYTAIDTLDQKLEKGVHFRVVGPLPPYSFSTIILTRIDPASIEEAKKILGLTGEITDKTVRDVYRQLVKEYHPDKMSGEESTEFQPIHEAYRTLESFIEDGLMHIEVYRAKQDVLKS